MTKRELAASTFFLGRYRVVEEIGLGGMASVHLARMDGPGGFQKWVAIKRIHPHLVEDEIFVTMFLDEARVAARISHPNVATVFELGKHEDTYWIAMEYLHGEPLREVMRRTEELGQTMPPEIACRIIADAAEGLHAAHELLGKNGEKLGLVHRDVTPHNLFVTYDGTTKVVDFGIAKFMPRGSPTRAPGRSRASSRTCRPSKWAGRPSTAAPTSSRSASCSGSSPRDSASSAWRPISTRSPRCRRATSRVPPWRADYPLELEEIVMKALARSRHERYATSREFSRALQSLLMRRGLFVGSDEVAAYMVTIFGDRMRKREAHLRWAAEVTQTVDTERLKRLAPSQWPREDGTTVTYDWDVPASPPSIARGPPPPAVSASRPDPIGDADDTIVSPAMPDMDVEEPPRTPAPPPEPSRGRPMAPRLLPVVRSLAEASTLTAQPATRRVRVWVAGAGYFVLGVAIVALVVALLGRLGCNLAPRFGGHPAPGAVGP